MNEFQKNYLQSWDRNDYVFSREQIGKLLESGRIDKFKAEYLMRLRYDLRPNNRLDVRDDDNCRVDIAEIRYYMTLL